MFTDLGADGFVLPSMLLIVLVLLLERPEWKGRWMKHASKCGNVSFDHSGCGAYHFWHQSSPFLIFPKGKEVPPVIQYLGKVLTPAVIGLWWSIV